MAAREKFLKISLTVFTVAVAMSSFWFGARLVKESQRRGPASIPPQHVYTDLAGDELTDAIKRRLVRDAKTFIRTGVFGVELGLFATRDDSGRVRSACELYPKIRARFVAGDMAVNGERPAIVIEGDCEPSGDGDLIAPLLVPYDELKKEKPVSRSFPAEMTFGNLVHTEHLADAWPEIWLLDQIELLNTNGMASVTVDGEEIRSLRGGQVIEIR